MLAETPDITIEELRRLLAGRGLDFGYGTIQRFLVRHGMTRKKKTGHASEQDRPGVLERRQAWCESQTALDPARLVFIDETWAKTNMARSHGRALKGRRLRMGQPHGHWKTSTFVAGLALTGMIAPFVLDGPINRLAFETYVERVLVPELQPGDIVIMDNLSSHKDTSAKSVLPGIGGSFRRWTVLMAPNLRLPLDNLGCESVVCGRGGASAASDNPFSQRNPQGGRGP